MGLMQAVENGQLLSYHYRGKTEIANRKKHTVIPLVNGRAKVPHRLMVARCSLKNDI